MGNFDPRYVTHLILDEGVGSKYDHWNENYKLHLQHVEGETSRRTMTKKTNMSPYVWTTKLQVVTTAWVEACIREGRRIPEDQFRLPSSFHRNNDTNIDSHPTKSGVQGALSSTMRGEEEEAQRISNMLKTKMAEDDIVAPTTSSGGRMKLRTKWEELVVQIPSLIKRCEHVLQQQQQLTNDDEDVNTRLIFAGQSFLLVGFDDDNGKNETGGKDSTTYGGGSSSYGHEIKNMISKLIRKFAGTIYYEPNEWITMVVLSLTNCVDDNNDYYNDSSSNNNNNTEDDERNERTKNDNDVYLRRKLLWNDVQYFCREHPNGPVCVDVDYILTTVYCDGVWDGVITPPFPLEPLPPQPRRKQMIVPKQQLLQQQQHQKKAKSETNGGGSGGEKSIGSGSVSTSIIASERRMKSNSSQKKTNSPIKKKIQTKQLLTNNTITTTSVLQKSDIFHGDVFVILPSVTTSDNSGTSQLFLGYSNEEMEITIMKHGGSIMNMSRSGTSYSLLDEFDAFRKTIAAFDSRIAHVTNYVVSNIHTKEYEQTGVLSGVVDGESIELIPVSSVWIAACVKHGCKYDPDLVLEIRSHTYY